jgi:hypothetical protein
LLLTSHPPFPGFAWRNENAILAEIVALPFNCHFPSQL